MVLGLTGCSSVLGPAVSERPALPARLPLFVKLAHEDLRSINGEIESLLKRAVEERRGKGKGNSE
jgi:hypothetical protein